MRNFEAIFNCMLIAIIIYQAIYFFIQFKVLQRIEILYYSTSLVCVGFYYYAYVLANILHLHFAPFISAVIFAAKFPFQFLGHMLYILFIIHYLELQKTRGLIYKASNYFKYYNIFFTLLFLALGILNIECDNLFHWVTLVLLLFSLVILALLWRINSFYGRVIFYGTLCSMAGVCGTHLFIMTGKNIDDPVARAYLPMQIGQLFDVLILGYGLSIKAVESDRKLLNYLRENQKVLEVERSRLAKDLHDGLGGMLSGIKLNLSSMKGNMVIKQSDALLFTKSINQLDKAIAEMRRVAHNMMPEALLRFGLGEAIQDYCDSINESNALNMKFTQLGGIVSMEKTTEVILYRIVQELCNNAIKHAAADNIFIQLTRHERGLTLTLEDDGKGFDKNQLKNMKGAGLQNVQSRVDYLKGLLQIESAIDNGTSVNIEIPM